MVVSPAETDLALVALTEADLGLIGRWLSMPQVRRWWVSPETGVSEITDHLAGDNVTPLLAVERWRPVGYLQLYHANGDPFWEGHALPRETFGLDLFLGEPDAIGRGLGPRFLRIAVDRLFAMPAVVRIQIDPAPGNAAAIRAFEKAGFRGSRIIDTPDGPARYMTIERGGAFTCDIVTGRG